MFYVLRDADSWLSNVEIAKAANVSVRTAQNRMKQYVDLGLVRFEDCADSSGGPRFRWNSNGNVDASYVERLGKAAEALGLNQAK